MSDSSSNVYDKYIDYDNQQLDTHNIGDEKIIQPITAENFEMNKRELGEVLTDQKFEIPEYQRLYSWKSKNNKQLWKDIEKFIQSDFSGDRREASDVFFSSMYFAVDEDEQKYEVIDGQQRLTTIHILFRVIMEHLEEVNIGNITDDTLADFQQFGINRIEDILYVQEDFAKKEPRLTLNKHDDELFEALMKGTEEQIDYLKEADYSIHGNNRDAVQAKSIVDRLGIERETKSVPTGSFFKLYRSHRRLLTAYEFFNEKVGELVDEAETANQKVRALVNVLNYVYNSYHVGEYLIREAEPDFRMKIFEILNDRGVDLSKIDRIRAAVVNAFFDTDVKEKYIKKWEDIVVGFATDDDAIDEYLSIYLSIIDDGIDKTGEASAELLNAFHTQTIESDVEPRLRHLNEAREFIDYAHELVDYYKHITNTEISAEELNLAGFREQCQEILVRLNRQRMNQWRPFILALYYHTNPSSKYEAERFYNVLDTIEKLNLRRLLASENSTIFRGVFIEAVEEFNLSPTDEETTDKVYQASQQFLIDEMRASSSSLFGDRFIDILTQSQSWNPETVRLLLGRITQDHFDENDSAVEQQLNMSNIHLEHILPQVPVDDKCDPTWLKKFFRLDGNPDTDITSRIQTYIELVQAEDLTDKQDRLKNSILEFITQRFIDDIGNFILLRDSDNIIASNQAFVEKVPAYYTKIEGYTSIYPNRYFTAEYGNFDRDKLDRLREQYPEGGVENVDKEVVEYFNSFWNYEALQDRRVALLLDILETLQFDSHDDEFGIRSNMEQVKQDISRKTREEFEKRLSVRSI